MVKVCINNRDFELSLEEFLCFMERGLLRNIEVLDYPCFG